MSGRLEGAFLSGRETFELLTSSLRELRASQIILISAFAKRDALVQLGEFIDSSNLVSLLVRWQPGDLVTGVSDVAAYYAAKERGWRFFMRQDLHAKVYSLGAKEIFVGSANLTGAGFSLSMRGNEEAVVRVQSSPEGREFVGRLFRGATEMTDVLAAEIGLWVEQREKDRGRTVTPQFPVSIERKIQLDEVPTELLVSECFLSDADGLVRGEVSLTDAEHHDLSILGLSYDQCAQMGQGELGTALNRARVVRWLVGQLTAAQGNELYFGRVSVLLHDAIMDDPKPYRRDVKELVSNLFSWISFAQPSGLHVDRPTYSQRVRLTT